jgi:cell pole-organizing protein PopZ
MEEILASIRKIISEDSPETPAPAAPQDHRAEDADVLELTQEIYEEPPSAPTGGVASPVDDVEFQPIEDAPASSPAPAPAASGEGLFSEKARKALGEAFTSLQEREEDKPSAPAAPIAPVDGRTIEAVFEQAVRGAFDPVLKDWLDRNKDAVIERMRPVVTAWLDEHFPSLLEQAVKEELARAAKSRMHR